LVEPDALTWVEYRNEATRTTRQTNRLYLDGRRYAADRRHNRLLQLRWRSQRDHPNYFHWRKADRVEGDKQHIYLSLYNLPQQ
jgi:hypothetical protein